MTTVTQTEVRFNETRFIRMSWGKEGIDEEMSEERVEYAYASHIPHLVVVILYPHGYHMPVISLRRYIHPTTEAR